MENFNESNISFDNFCFPTESHLEESGDATMKALLSLCKEADNEGKYPLLIEKLRSVMEERGLISSVVIEKVLAESNDLEFQRKVKQQIFSKFNESVASVKSDSDSSTDFLKPFETSKLTAKSAESAKNVFEIREDPETEVYNALNKNSRKEELCFVLNEFEGILSNMNYFENSFIRNSSNEEEGDTLENIVFSTPNVKPSMIRRASERRLRETNDANQSIILGNVLSPITRRGSVPLSKSHKKENLFSPNECLQILSPTREYIAPRRLLFSPQQKNNKNSDEDEKLNNLGTHQKHQKNENVVDDDDDDDDLDDSNFLDISNVSTNSVEMFNAAQHALDSLKVTKQLKQTNNNNNNYTDKKEKNDSKGGNNSLKKAVLSSPKANNNLSQKGHEQTKKSLIVVAEYDYEQNNRSSHLCMSSGDLIEVTKPSNEHWWYGINKETHQKGWFPAKFVKIIDENYYYEHVAQKRRVIMDSPNLSPIKPSNNDVIDNDNVTKKVPFSEKNVVEGFVEVNEETKRPVRRKKGPQGNNNNDDEGNGFGKYHLPNHFRSPTTEFIFETLSPKVKRLTSTADCSTAYAKYMASRKKDGNGNAKANEKENSETQSKNDIQVMNEAENEKKLKKRNYMVNEVLTSERTYVKNLSILKKNFIEKIRNSKSMKSFGLTFQQFKNIIANTEIIWDLHNRFLKQLELASEKDGSYSIFKIFRKEADFLKIYTDYVSKFDTQCIRTIKELSTNKKFQSFLRIFEKECNQTLTSLLILPVQRIPRYEMLLNGVLKLTSVTDKHYADLKFACLKITEIAKHVNENKRQVENMDKILQIQRSIRNLKMILMEPHRRFVRRENLLMIAPKKRNYHFILFNDLLLWVSVDSQALKGVINMSLVDEPETIGAGMSTVLKYREKGCETKKASHSIHLWFADSNQKTIWMTDIKKSVKWSRITKSKRDRVYVNQKMAVAHARKISEHEIDWLYPNNTNSNNSKGMHQNDYNNNTDENRENRGQVGNVSENNNSSHVKVVSSSLGISSNENGPLQSICE